MAPPVNRASCVGGSVFASDLIFFLLPDADGPPRFRFSSSKRTWRDVYI
jgi:hypothetical protein